MMICNAGNSWYHSSLFSHNANFFLVTPALAGIRRAYPLINITNNSQDNKLIITNFYKLQTNFRQDTKSSDKNSYKNNQKIIFQKIFFKQTPVLPDFKVCYGIISLYKESLEFVRTFKSYLTAHCSVL